MDEKEYIKNEIRKEFQLDRIVLFSDAVFAIVITLMAIEIRLPHESTLPLSGQILNLAPVMLAYAVSFAFIGHLWYQHLHFFGLLKDYDSGLVVRNLLMLFCIGFFPFSATLVANKQQTLLPYLVYWVVVICCKGTQVLLQHYILVKRPHLCVQSGIHQEMKRFKKSRVAFVLFFVCSLLVFITMSLISDPDLKQWAWWWFTPMPFIIKYFKKRIDRKTLVHTESTALASSVHRRPLQKSK